MNNEPGKYYRPVSEFNRQANAIASLRDAGYAVVIFSPSELSGADADHVEDRLIELGWDVIDSLRTETEEEITEL